MCVFAEVEQLLEPEERAILQHNEIPNLQMISTVCFQLVLSLVCELQLQLILNCLTYETLQKKWKPLQTLALSMQIQLMDNLMDNGLDIDDVDKVLLLNRKCCRQLWFLVFTV